MAKKKIKLVAATPRLEQKLKSLVNGDYDRPTKLSDSRKRERKEQKIVNPYVESEDGQIYSAILVKVREITPAGAVINSVLTGELVGTVVFPDALVGTTGTMEVGQTLVVYPILHDGTILNTSIPEG